MAETETLTTFLERRPRRDIGTCRDRDIETETTTMVCTHGIYQHIPKPQVQVQVLQTCTWVQLEYKYKYQVLHVCLSKYILHRMIDQCFQ